MAVLACLFFFAAGIYVGVSISDNDDSNGGDEVVTIG